MFKLMRYMRKRDWTFVVLILALTVLQVFCMMTMMDYIQGVTPAITYVSYNVQGPSVLGLPAIYTSWEAVMQDVDVLAPAIAAGSGQEVAAVRDMIVSVANAGSGDIWFNAGMMLVCALGLMACQAIISVLSAYISSNLATRIRTAVNDKIHSFSLAEINKFSTE